MTYNRKIMRLELSAEKALNGGYYYAELLLPAADYEIKDANSIDLQIRIAEIDAEFKKMLDRVSTDTIEAFDEETATRLMNEKSRLQQQLESIADAEQRRENAKSRLDDIYTILDGIKNRPMEYDDRIVRQLLECVVVDSKEQITVIFKGGLKSVQPLTE